MALDRAIGALCVGAVALVASLGLVAGASTPPPPREPRAVAPPDDGLGPIDDPETVAAFLDLRDRSERATRVLEADWERRVDGMVVLSSPWLEVRDGAADHLVEAFGNLTGVYDGKVINCGVIEPVEPPPDEDPQASVEEGAVHESEDTGAQEDEEVDPFELLVNANGFAGCETGPAPDPQDEAARTRSIVERSIAPGTGDYTVQRAPGRRLLGVDTECFVLRRRATAGWLYGEETTMCWSPDAAPMLVERREGTAVDTRRTTSVRSDVTEADFAALLAPRADDLAAADLRSAP